MRLECVCVCVWPASSVRVIGVSNCARAACRLFVKATRHFTTFSLFSLANCTSPFVTRSATANRSRVSIRLTICSYVVGHKDFSLTEAVTIGSGMYLTVKKLLYRGVCVGIQKLGPECFDGDMANP